MQISQRKAGVILSYLSQIIQILSGLIYTPIMLRFLGQSEYGLYQLVYSVVSYLGLLSFGFSSSYIRFYSRIKTKNDKKEISKLNGMFLSIFIFLSLICVICGIIMLSQLKTILGNGLTDAEFGTAKILFAIMVVNLALTFPNSVFDSIISAHEQFIFQRTILILQNILNPFLTLPLLIMGFGSVGMVMVVTVLTIAKLFINVWFCIKKLQEHFIFRDFNFLLLKEMWVFTFFIFINLIVDQINWSVDKFLLGRISGTVAVAIYGVSGQLNTMYMQLSTSISNVFIPKVNKIVAENNNDDELTDLFIKVGRIQFIILSLVITGFIFFGRRFIEIWAGNGYSNSYIITLLLIIPVTIPLVQNLGLEIQRAKNIHKVRSIVYLFIALGNILLSIPLIHLYGEIGAALGTAITMILGNGVFMNIYYQKRVGLNIFKFWKQTLLITRSLIIPVIFGIIVTMYLNFDNNIIYIICGLVYILVFIFSMWNFGMNDQEKHYFSNPLKKFIKS
ncbi:MAG: oligosaccharide flippase family protein [Erysipelotrichaceae bacterium]|nr:oligosaccharide flippase family protein [Erysipelotrichaceae bacterium]